MTMKKILILCLVLCMVTALVIPAYATGSISPTNWMASIDGSLTLAQFTIPGTHDSCTQYCVLGRCQHVCIKEQMNMGARFLDIRLKNDRGTLNCYHGFVNCLYSFKQVMEAVSAFLKANPTETVIMSIRNEGDSSAEFESILVNQWIDAEKYSDLFYTEDRIPTLNEVRGKIVLLRRYKNYDISLARGINAGKGWKDNAAFLISGNNCDMFIQDIYSYDTIGLTFGKNKFANFEAFDKSISENDPGNSPDVLHINFASGCNSISCGQLSCAVAVNPKLSKLMQNADGNHGIVIMDYVDSKLVKTVYETNFR